MNWYLLVLKRYFVFQGRSSRSEYWWFTLINTLASIVLSIFDSLLGWVVFVVPTGGGFDYQAPLFGTLYSLAVLIPSIAVTVRRLHDTNRSAWWLLWLFVVPLLSLFMVFALMVLANQAPVILPSQALWLVALLLLSGLGGIVFLIFLLLPSQAKANRYGPVPVREPGA